MGKKIVVHGYDSKLYEVKDILEFFEKFIEEYLRQLLWFFWEQNEEKEVWRREGCDRLITKSWIISNLNIKEVIGMLRNGLGKGFERMLYTNKGKKRKKACYQKVWIVPNKDWDSNIFLDKEKVFEYLAYHIAEDRHKVYANVSDVIIGILGYEKNNGFVARNFRTGNYDISSYEEKFYDIWDSFFKI